MQRRLSHRGRKGGGKEGEREGGREGGIEAGREGGRGRASESENERESIKNNISMRRFESASLGRTSDGGLRLALSAPVSNVM